jgi:hypothetical protein
MLVFELTRIESSRSYYTTEFFNRLLTKLIDMCVSCVSVLDDCLSVGPGVGYQIRFWDKREWAGALYKPILHKGSLMTASWGVGRSG